MRHFLFILGSTGTHYAALSSLLKVKGAQPFTFDVLYHGASFGISEPDIEERLNVSGCSRLFYLKTNKVIRSPLSATSFFSYLKALSDIQFPSYDAIIFPNVNNIRNTLIALYFNNFYSNSYLVELQDGIYPGGFKFLSSFSLGKVFKYKLKKIFTRVVFFSFHFIYRFPRSFSTLPSPLKINCLFAWGEFASKYAAEFYSDIYKDIRITGQPRFDCLVESLGCSAVQVESKIFKILYLPNANLRNSYEFSLNEGLINYKSILEAINLLSRDLSVDLTIKLHPSESFDYILDTFSFPENVSIVSSSNLHRLIRSSDVCITHSSTAGLESLAMGVPLCVLNLHGRVPFFDFNQINNVSVTNSTEELFEKLKALSSDRGLFIDSNRPSIDYFMKNVGMSSNITLKILLSDDLYA